MWGFSIHRVIHLGLESYPKDCCRVCTECDSGEISRRAQSLEHIGHPSDDHALSIVLNFDFQEGVLLLCVTYSLQKSLIMA